MNMVIDLSEKELRDENSKEIPVYAAIAIGNEVISISKNMIESLNSPLMHAEFIAITESLKKLNVKYLDMASIYVNLEPCSFCSSALELVRIKNIFFGAYSIKTGGIDHGAKIFDHSQRRPNIIGGIQEERCSNIIRNFFRRKLVAGAGFEPTTFRL